jgi:hypothetical protein
MVCSTHSHWGEDVLETECFRPQVRGEPLAMLCPLERVNLNCPVIEVRPF